MDQQLKKLTKEILIACKDDYTGLWQFVNRIQKSYPSLKSSSKLKPFILDYILELVEKGFITIGHLLEDGSFETWTESPKDAVVKVDEWWDGSRYESDALYGIWFDITEKGEAELKRLQELKEE